MNDYVWQRNPFFYFSGQSMHVTKRFITVWMTETWIEWMKISLNRRFVHSIRALSNDRSLNYYFQTKESFIYYKIWFTTVFSLVYLFQIMFSKAKRFEPVGKSFVLFTIFWHRKILSYSHNFIFCSCCKESESLEKTGRWSANSLQDSRNSTEG